MTNSTNPTFGAMLRRLRQAAGLTQEELAERANISVRGLSDIERGVRAAPHAHTVQLLVEALSLPAADRDALLATVSRRRGPSQTRAGKVTPARFSGFVPAESTPLVGREQIEAAAVHLFQRGTRLLTFVGPGGVGKSRLATRVALTMANTYADGAAFVSLATTRDPTRVAATIASRLGIQETSGLPLEAQLCDALREGSMLLVLDNFEHVIDAALVVAELLVQCPRLAILVTSREPLSLRGEQLLDIPPLDLPTAGVDIDASTVERFAAIDLFMQRARQARPDFRLEDREVSVIVEICRRLDGLPLAIELAAARIRFMSLDALLARLERRLDVLHHGPRDAPARQQTMRAAIAWSYNLLSPEEQALFRRLSVFVGGCTLTSLELVCLATDGSQGGTLECLETLKEKSLVRQVDTPDGEHRFGMLETIRNYGLECLTREGSGTVNRAHALHYLALAEEAEPHVTGPGQSTWLARLETEHDNLRAAMHWMRAQGELELGLRMAGALAPFWYVRGHRSEGRDRIEESLATAADLEDGARLRAVVAKARHAAGLLAAAQSDHARAVVHYEKSLALFEELGDTRGQAEALSNLGIVAYEQGECGRAISLHERALARRRATGDRRGVASSLNNLGVIAQTQGQFGRAATFFEESLDLYRDMGAARGIAIALSNLGYAAWHQGDYVQATALTEESLAVRRELGDREGVAIALSNLGEIACLQGDLARAAAQQLESLALFEELGSTWGVLFCLQRLALVGREGAPRYHAARLSGALSELRARTGLPLPEDEQARVDAVLATLRGSLGELDFGAAWREGQSMALDQAVDAAREIGRRVASVDIPRCH